VAAAEGNRFSGSRIPCGSGELSALFFFIILMSSVLFNLLGIFYRGKIPDLRLEVLRPTILPDLGKDLLYFHSCPQTAYPASVFITTTNSGSTQAEGTTAGLQISHNQLKKKKTNIL